MASPLTLENIRNGTIHVGKKIKKIENQRLFENDVYVEVGEEKRQTVLFWTPELQCAKKDENHMSIFLPQTDECEEFYNTLVHLDDTIITKSSEKWKNWFEKDELSHEDVQERFVSCIKPASKEEQGRVMNVKTSSHIKSKVDGMDEITDDYSSLFDSKTKKGFGKMLIELRRIIFGRGNFKIEYVVHQILLNAPEIEEPITERFNNESWVDFQ